MKKVAIIPLRKNSKGIPGKNKKKMLGRPLFSWVLKEALFSNLDEVYIFTNDTEIITFIENEYHWTSKVKVLLRSDESATDTASTEKAMIEFAEIIDNDIIDKDGEPLTYSYYREVRKGKAPKNAPTYINYETDTDADSLPGKERFKCLICGHVFDPAIGDPEHGIPAGTDFNDLPDDWKCPTCGTDKYSFDLI